MTQDLDKRIAGALREGAPPARDALFRLEVLEHRERRLFRRRALGLLAVALATAMVAAFGAVVGGVALEAATVLLLGAVIVAAGVFVPPAVTRLFYRVGA